MINLDGCSDPAVNALATLAKHSVNAKLQEKLGGDAIKHAFGSPLPLSLIGQGTLPCIAIYRLQDRNRDRGQWIYENQATFRFDYFAPATPLVRLDKRWPLLHAVWAILASVMRIGKDPSVADSADVLGAGGLQYVIEATQTCNYSFVPGAAQTYPSFQGSMAFVEDMETPAAFDPQDLSSFDELWTDWNLKPETNDELEAQNLTKPNG